MRVIFFIASILVIIPSMAYPFDIYPYRNVGSGELIGEGKWRDKVKGVITDPIHEEMTLRSIQLAKKTNFKGSESIDNNFIEKVVKGSQWNDDPLGYFPKRPEDWVVYFKHAGWILPKLNDTYDLLYRTHYHDLQFFHAMASSDIESTTETKDKILTWIEFSYKVSIGDINPRIEFKNVDQYLSQKSGKIFNSLFIGNGTRTGWTPTYLFSLKCDRVVIIPFVKTKLNCDETSWVTPNQDVQNIALGSILHVIQDSFSDSHTARIPQYDDKFSLIHGRNGIKSFNLYSGQSSSEHKKADQYPNDYNSAMSGEGNNLEDVSIFIITKVLTDRENKSNSWPEVFAGLSDGCFSLSNTKDENNFAKYK